MTAIEAASEHEALIQFLYLSPVGLVQTSIDGEIALINPISAQLLMPLSVDGGLSNLFTALAPVAPELPFLTRQFQGDHGLVCEALSIQVDAGTRGLRDARFMSLTLLKLDADRLMAVLTDTTAQVRRERLLRQNEAWLKAIFTGITDYALMRLDGRGRIVEWNSSIGRVTGFTRSDALNSPYSIFYPPGATTPDRLLDRLHEADENGWSLDDGWRIRADGTQYWGSAMIAPLPSGNDDPAENGRVSDDEAPAYCLVIRDITDKREATETLRRATSCDHLTGIANRRAFFDAGEIELERWHRSPRQLSLILFDADLFKAVNDTHGHPAGDAVLRHFANALVSSFRAVDVVARVGGEEFAVLLPSTEAASALAVANRLREHIAAQTVVVDGASIRYTVSGGVATMDAGVTGLDMLMKRADEALYVAKRNGRNRVVAWSPVPSKPSAALLLEAP